MFTWLTRAGRGGGGLARGDAQCWLGHTTTCMPHNWTDRQDLGQPGADKRQTRLLDKGGSGSPPSKSQHPHPASSQQLLADLLRFGDQSSCIKLWCTQQTQEVMSTWHHPRRVSGEITPSKGESDTVNSSRGLTYMGKALESILATFLWKKKDMI